MELQQELKEKDRLIQQLQGTSSRPSACQKGRSGSDTQGQGDEDSGAQVQNWTANCISEIISSAASRIMDNQTNLHDEMKTMLTPSENQNGDASLSELNDIAREMNKLRKPKKKKTKATRGGLSSTEDSRGWSGTSGDSGICVTVGDKSDHTSSHSTKDARISSAASNLSALSEWDSSDNEELVISARHKKPFSAKSGASSWSSDLGEEGSGTDEERSKDSALDPASIRRISAAKDRRRKAARQTRSQQGNVHGDSGKPPLHRTSTERDASIYDADSLLRSFDEDAGFPSVGT